MMSVQQIEARVCDQCSVVYTEEIPSWMILTFPNAGGVVDAESVPEYDFCTYQCLEAWVNEDESGEEPEDAIRAANDAGNERQAQERDEAQAKLDAAMAVMNEAPPMSLADAIASGQLNFSRDPQ